MAGKGKPFKKLKRGAVIFGKDLNPVLDMLNAIINGEIVSGNSNELLIGDLKILWRIKSSTSSGSSSYRGEYSPDGATQFNPGPFAFGDIVRVSPDNANATPTGLVTPGVYICAKDGPTEDDLPQHPAIDGENEFWHWISTWPSVMSICNGDGTASDVVVDQQLKPS